MARRERPWTNGFTVSDKTKLKPGFHKVFGEHYPIRATSEILLIVVGVLLALAIDAWWAERQQRDSERRYLEALLADVRTDVNEYAILASELEAYQRATKIMIRVVDGHDVQVDSPSNLSKLLHCSTFLGVPVVSRGTMDDLLSTGNLALLRERAIRRNVLAYFSRIDASKQFIDEYRSYQIGYRQIVLEFWPLIGADDDITDTEDLSAVLRADARIRPALNRMQYGQLRKRMETIANGDDAAGIATELEGALRQSRRRPSVSHTCTCTIRAISFRLRGHGILTIFSDLMSAIGRPPLAA